MSVSESSLISTFFDAWSKTDAAERHALITSALSAGASYGDPRSGSELTGIDAISDYVGAFSANAPGWAANVVNVETSYGVSRATIAFGGMGPDGNEMVQHGQYFVEAEGEKIIRMIGFVGTGQPD